MPRRILFLLMIALAACAADRVTAANGILEGAPAAASGVRIFRGIPFALPPVGDLDVTSKADAEQHADRYAVLDQK